MAEKSDPHIVALEAVYAALKDFDAPGRKRFSLVFALLDIEAIPQQQLRQSGQSSVFDERVSPSTASRPLSLVELIQEKQPGTSAQRIALFAYYREKVEGFPRFSRDDLENHTFLRRKNHRQRITTVTSWRPFARDGFMRMA